jgi:hypothetical protein
MKKHRIALIGLGMAVTRLAAPSVSFSMRSTRVDLRPTAAGMR